MDKQAQQLFPWQMPSAPVLSPDFHDVCVEMVKRAKRLSRLPVQQRRTRLHALMAETRKRCPGCSLLATFARMAALAKATQA